MQHRSSTISCTQAIHNARNEGCPVISGSMGATQHNLISASPLNSPIHTPGLGSLAVHNTQCPQATHHQRLHGCQLKHAPAVQQASIAHTEQQPQLFANLHAAGRQAGTLQPLHCSPSLDRHRRLLNPPHAWEQRHAPASWVWHREGCSCHPPMEATTDVDCTQKNPCCMHAHCHRRICNWAMSMMHVQSLYTCAAAAAAAAAAAVAGHPT
jgi:hypothetical protein